MGPTYEGKVSLSRSNIPTLALSARDCAVLIDGAVAVMHYDIVTETEQYIEKAQLQAARLSESLRRTLGRFRRRGDRSGGFIITGIPVGDVPQTPEHADLAVGTTLEAAAVLSILMAPLGEQYGFKP